MEACPSCLLSPRTDIENCLGGVRRARFINDIKVYLLIIWLNYLTVGVAEVDVKIIFIL